MNFELENSLHRVKIRFAVAAALLLAAFLGLSVIWNKSIKEELANQATTLIRRSLLLGDTRAVLQSLSGIRSDSFESITEFGADNKRIVTLPPSVAPKNYDDRNLFEQFLYGEIKTNLYLDEDAKVLTASLSFMYSRFELAQYALAIWALVVVLLSFPFLNAREKVSRELNREIELRNSLLIHDLVKKVRHNIRSPLAVLTTYFSSSDELAVTLKDQGRRAIGRIEEILSEIEGSHSYKSIAKEKANALVEISSLVAQIVEEKRLIASGISISFSISSSAQGIYSSLPARDFKATISNIIDNSIQATKENGHIEVRIEADGHLISLNVADNGHGIPKEFVSKVTEKGFSHGKSGGTGLGLFYAKKLMEDNGGNLVIESSERGTQVTLFFPQKVTPTWHCGEISLAGVQKLHICDDQLLIREVIQQRLGVRKDLETRYHQWAEHLLASPDLHGDDLLLIDYDFGEGRMNGLEAIIKAGMPRRAVLITGHYDDPQIQQACASTGCRLLPKDQISSIKFA